MERVEEAWNKIARGLLQLEHDLKEFQIDHSSLNGLEHLNLKAQELFSLATMQSEVTVFIERITRYAYINGGLGYLLIEEPKETTDETEDEDEDE